MDAKHTVEALGALAHEHRLTIYRMLVEHEPDGLSVGVITERLGVPQTSLTFHLQHLLRAGLVTQQRRGRHNIYAINSSAMDDLLAFLIEKCCGQGGAGGVRDTAAANAARPLSASQPPPGG